jgi:hypothetical protein
MRATAPNSDRFARRTKISLTRGGWFMSGGVASARRSPHARAGPRSGARRTISVDFVDGLRLADPVPLWFGVALLCLGGDAPAVNLPETREASFLALYAPPSIEGPGLRLPEPLTRLYLDGTYARTDDLSGLPLIAGSAHNYRFAVGGSLAWRRFSFDGEVVFSNITTIDVTLVPGGGPPFDQDKHQTATSLGDTRLGASWTTPLGESGALVGGFGLRFRLPTHTVVFQFHIGDGTQLGRYVFPYYFHIEPTLILGGSFGRFGFVVNQGLLLMVGPDGDFQDLHIVEPNLLFWSSHTALFYSPLRVLGVSADLGSDVQINRVTAMYFEKVNDIVAISLNLGLQIQLDRMRIDLIGRRGLTRDVDLFGALQYAGTQSLTLRVGLSFD